MDQEEEDEGTINALILRMDEDRIPRARGLLDKVKAGEVLTDRDIGIFKKGVQRQHEQPGTYHA